MQSSLLQAIHDAKQHGYGPLQRFDHTKSCHDCGEPFLYLHCKDGESVCPACTAERISKTTNPTKP